MPKILIVEDNELNRDMLSRRLERRGFTVVLAIDGGEGVAKARSEVPDLVLMDMSLPVMNGWEATRADPATGHLLVIAPDDGVLHATRSPVKDPNDERSPSAWASATALRLWPTNGNDEDASYASASESPAGYATCGQIGFEGRFEYTASGTVMNLAARLGGEAQGGEVLAAERVVAALGDTVVTESAGSIELKGMARPVAIHQVAGLQ